MDIQIYIYQQPALNPFDSSSQLPHIVDRAGVCLGAHARKALRDANPASEYYDTVVPSYAADPHCSTLVRWMQIGEVYKQFKQGIEGQILLELLV